MKTRWAPGFTIVELILTVVIIGIILTLGVLGYQTVRKQAAEKAVQSDLTNFSSLIEHNSLRTGTYPTSLPSGVTSSAGVTTTLDQSGTYNFYSPLSNVQEGVLFRDICQTLINEGVGRGVNQGGTTENYISGCGQWNDDSTQITGWETRQYNTPVQEATLRSYADNFTVSNAWNKAAQEATVKNFYGQLIERFKQQGGTFPIDSFFDYWATPGNGVMEEALPTPKLIPYYCIEASHAKYPDLIWHISSGKRLAEGSC